MVEPTDQEFLRSIFLMEAWDTLAAIEDGVGRLAAGAEPAWDELFVVTHRLKGAASLHGFRHVAALADAVERGLQPLKAAPAPERRAAAADAHGPAGRAQVGAGRDRAPPPGGDGGVGADHGAAARGPRPRRDADPVRRDLLRFFADGDEVLAYFGPEAAEHLEAMSAALRRARAGGLRRCRAGRALPRRPHAQGRRLRRRLHAHRRPRPRPRGPAGRRARVTRPR